MCRYMYSESLGRWRTADLLIGLAYLARREGQEHPVADIAAKAKPVRLADVKPAHQTDVLVWTPVCSQTSTAIRAAAH